ncbi:hypothetical protein GCK72_011649 [Caenorhabditis remanei]|uniref:Uncharacterized protein n=1 Tax=Caenorhabditis remanei TaxID=31234 RepID=A0A6A5HAB9_CAERE|nr:hypothetical protein GCK72_011649 [Caenorhabditis remanei]KAF1763383.1 hypothetical protein GCK72_011649 [Caenorhabditis remanei]
MGTTMLTVFLTILGMVKTQFMGYPYDYSSMFSGYTGYNPMMSMTNTMGTGALGMNTMGMNTGFGTFGTGLESLYGGAQTAGMGQQQMFGAYNPYGNGMFNFGNNGMFGQNAFGTGFNNNMFGGAATGANNGLFGGVQQQAAQTMNTGYQNTQPINTLNNGNTMKAYGRRSTAQNFNNNNNYAPTRVGQGGCGGGNTGGFGGGCGQQQQGWNSKAKKV